MLRPLILLITLGLGPMAGAAEMKDWTLLVFLNGHNDLDQYGETNIKQMEKVGSTEKVNVVVQWASISAAKTKRLYIQKSSNSSRVTSPVVQELAPVDMGSPNSLLEFIKWGKEHYPARHYFIDVWNHGSGWHSFQGSAKKKGAPHSTDISWDDRFGTHITTQELGQVIRSASKLLGQKVDIYGSDACLMAMAEVNGEIKNAVNVVVGSEETEPSLGWPYDQLLTEWNKLPAATAEQVGAILVQEYLKSYSRGQNGSDNVTLSALRLSGWPKFEAAFRQFSQEVMAANGADRSAMKKVAAQTESYLFSDYKDAVHFLEGLAAAKIGGLKAETLEALKAAIQAMMVANGVSQKYRNSHGLSLWIPGDRGQYDQFVNEYSNLDFGRASKWTEALKKMLGN